MNRSQHQRAYPAIFTLFPVLSDVDSGVALGKNNGTSMLKSDGAT